VVSYGRRRVIKAFPGEAEWGGGSGGRQKIRGRAGGEMIRVLPDSIRRPIIKRLQKNLSS